MKTIVLVRHAHSPSDGFAEDSLRGISARGEKEHEKLCYALKEEELVPARIFASPLKRGEESGSIMADFFDLPLEIVPAFDGEHSVESMLKALEGIKDEEIAVIVTHLPSIQKLGKHFYPEKKLVILPTSGAYIITF